MNTYTLVTRRLATLTQETEAYRLKLVLLAERRARVAREGHPRSQADMTTRRPLSTLPLQRCEKSGFGGDVFGRAKLPGITDFCGKPTSGAERPKERLSASDG